MSCARALLIVSACFVAQAQNASPTAEEINTRIERDGAAKVVQQLTAGNAAKWHQVIDKIDTGESAWLDVAGKLLKVTDAGGTEDLRVSLAVALTHNPEGVLRMTGPDLALEQVCTVPFIEPSKKAVTAHKAKVQAAMKRVTAKELQEKKVACLKAIDAISP